MSRERENQEPKTAGIRASEASEDMCPEMINENHSLTCYKPFSCLDLKR